MQPNPRVLASWKLQHLSQHPIHELFCLWKLEPETTFVASAENASDVKTAASPSINEISTPVTAPQVRTVLSYVADKIIVPSGENTTGPTAALGPF